MKQISLFMAVIWCIGLNAQKQTKLVVQARALYIAPAPVYKAAVSVSSNYSSYPAEAITLSQLLAQYNSALEKKGLSLGDLTENKTAYTVLGYEKEGTVYEFQTTSLQAFEKFLATSSFGVQRLSYGASFIINPNEATTLARKALENAQSKAAIWAKAMDRTIIGILRVEDNNLIGTEIFKSLYYDQLVAQHGYEIQVEFALE